MKSDENCSSDGVSVAQSSLPSSSTSIENNFASIALELTKQFMTLITITMQAVFMLAKDTDELL